MTCGNSCFNGRKRKGFLHRIVTGDGKWIHYDNPKRRTWGNPSRASASAAKSNIYYSKLLFCIWRDQLGVVCYELLKPTETIAGDRYRLHLTRLSQIFKRNDSYTSRYMTMWFATLPRVAKWMKTFLEKLKWEVPPQPLYSPVIAPLDNLLSWLIVHGLVEPRFHSYEDAKKWIDDSLASKDESFFPTWNHNAA